jgi:NADH:ubiquinone oxidoreductase subunit H
MNLILAHRILIAAAVLLLLFYGGWEFARQDGPGAVWRGALSLAAAVAFAIYFAAIGRLYTPGRKGAP